MNDSVGRQKDIQLNKSTASAQGNESVVLEKAVFINVFDKDIRKIYIYKKAERLAKALQLLAPAFKENPSLQTRLERISVGLIDAAIAPSNLSREALSRELLALSSMLAIAKAGGILSPMNADFIVQESNNLLVEVAGYEEPRLMIEDAPTVAQLARASVVQPQKNTRQRSETGRTAAPKVLVSESVQIRNKGHIKDININNSRREAILSVIRDKGSVYIKEVSNHIRNVSEKTIQRELQALVIEGVLSKAGERRWTRYTLVS